MRSCDHLLQYQGKSIYAEAASDKQADVSHIMVAEDDVATSGAR